MRDPNPAPELVYRIQSSSSPSWFSILFSGSGNPLAQVSLRPDAGGDFVPLHRGNDNYWSLSGLGAGPFTAEVTDIYGHAAFVSGIAMDPGPLHHTGIRLYEIPTEPPATPPPPTAPVVVTTVLPPSEGCKP
ncbi:hypothetical protein D7D52_07525 [Nocardia yunnanensis]|uniref:Uncharacterized protein n=1 Tax=Nocardia yunnanensis TaxID=2382165 RepID=A0A386Z7I1_9NOCA|nr:hypothetical protein D7D52_07525 [Nocardia yunnanensis]